MASRIHYYSGKPRAWARARATAPGLGAGKLNGDTKIADVGKKVYEGCFAKRDFIRSSCTKVDERPDATKEVAQLFFLSPPPLLPILLSRLTRGKKKKYAAAKVSRFQLARKPFLPPCQEIRLSVNIVAPDVGIISIWIRDKTRSRIVAEDVIKEQPRQGVSECKKSINRK